MSDTHTQVLRIGKISSVNYKNGTARVTYEDRDGSTTNELPFLAWTYWMPKVGDKVLVGHLSNGSTSAVILGPTWGDDHRPADFGEDLYRQELSTTPGEAAITYSRKTGILTIKGGHIEFSSTTDGVAITAAALVSQIRALQQRCKDLESRCSTLEGQYTALDQRCKAHGI